MVVEQLFNVRMYDAQINLKANSPQSRVAKESMHKSGSPSTRSSCQKSPKYRFACVYFEIGKSPSFTDNSTRVTSKRESDWTPHGNNFVSFKFKLQLKFTSFVSDVSGPLTPSHLRFSCLFFAVCADYEVYVFANANVHDCFFVFNGT